MPFSTNKMLRLMEAKGISQTQLADMLGVPRQQVGYWVRGMVVPSAKYLELIAQILECSIDDLFEPETAEGAVA
ncbi:MAG: helix-turn-helix transcriptional regulator [Bryobacteraceae bacterium]